MHVSRKNRLVAVSVAIVITALAATGYMLKARHGGAKPATAADSVSASGEGKTDDAVETVPVEVSVAGPHRISSYYSTTATLEPDRRVDVFARIEGVVRELLVEEGDRVRAGDVLCRLDDSEQKITLEEARIKRDQSAREYERIKRMHERDLVSDKEYDDARNAYELSRNAFESAALRFNWTVIRAPFDGLVVVRAVELGTHVTPALQLFTVADVDPLELVMYLPEAAIREVRTGQRILIVPDNGADRSFEGEIVRIAPEVDRGTGTVKVTATTRGHGMPGSFARVRIVTGTRENALTIPRRCIVANAGEKYVFVAQADTVRRVDISVGFEDEDLAEITSGLAPGDTVVAAGVGALRQGARVRVVPPAGDPAPLTR